MKIGVAAISAIVLLAACTVDPVKDNAAAIARAQAQGVPVLIFERQADDALGFINVSPHPVSAVELKLVVCGVRGQTSADIVRPYWLHLLIKGDFQSGFAFKVRDAKVTAIDANGRVINPKMEGFGWRSKIVAAWVRFADATPQRAFVGDVSAMLAPQVSNNCPIDVQSTHTANWLFSLPRN